MSFSYESLENVSKSNPSSNRPEYCSKCKSWFWSYNMLLHYQEKHVGVSCPLLISEKEREAVLKFTS